MSRRRTRPHWAVDPSKLSGAWYARNGYEVGKNLFTTSEIGELDMRGIEGTAKAVQAALA
jgi:hypothetical protein